MRLSALLFLSSFLPLALSVAGCLPSSQRAQTHTLLPSDSLSRRVAETAPVDTLALVWRSAPEGLELPTSLAWLGDGAAADTTAADSAAGPPSPPAGRLVVADTRHGALRLFAARDGRDVQDVRPADGLGYPYLAGTAGDTAVVLLRGENRLAWVPLDGGPARVARSVPVPEGTTAALVTPRGIWAKRADETDAWLVRLDARGQETARYPLPGPSWRRIGFLRAWGDTTLSLAGYRPVVDVLLPSARAARPPDTLALVGFDSPQLVRSHQYVRGEVDQPPLLTSAAVADGDRLFVLNLRADHVRIDVFGRDGRIERALVFPDAEGTAAQFPVDLAVRRDGAAVWIAVLMQQPGGVFSEPGGRVLMLRWPGPGA